jgi:hypothetical protein
VSAIALEWNGLFAAGDDDTEPVVWSDGTDRVLVHLASLRVTRTPAWLVCDVDLEPLPARRRRVRIALHAGMHGEDRVRAAARISGPRRARAWLAERCAADLEQALWDALLA